MLLAESSKIRHGERRACSQPALHLMLSSFTRALNSARPAHHACGHKAGFDHHGADAVLAQLLGSGSRAGVVSRSAWTRKQGGRG